MLDETGFKRKTYADLLAEGEARSKELFGENVNTSAKTPLGILLRIICWFLTPLWMLAENIYLSGFVDTAKGVSLDRQSVYAGIRRKTDTKARGDGLQLTGTPGYTVNPGLLVAKQSGVQYVVTNAVTLDGAGVGTTTVEAIEAGSIGNAAVGEISVLVNPDANLTAVTNLVELANGGDRENDTVFRARFRSSRAARGSSNLNALLAAVAALAGVRAVSVVENETLVVDGAGRPGKSFETYVLGGDDLAIAKAVFDNKPGGIQSWGTISTQVTDISGTPRTIRHSRPATRSIYSSLIVTTNSEAPANIEDRVKDAVVSYIGGEATDGTILTGSNMGEDVLWAEVIWFVRSLPGVVNVRGGISLIASNYATDDIAIQPQEVAQIDAVDIGVTIQ